MGQVERMHQIASKYPRIFIASVNPIITEQDILDIFSVFGTIKQLEYPRDTLV